MRRNVSLFYEKKRKRRNYEKIPHSFTATDANEDTVLPFSGILQLKNGNTKLHHETNIFSFWPFLPFSSFIFRLKIISYQRNCLTSSTFLRKSYKQWTKKNRGREEKKSNLKEEIAKSTRW